MASASSDQLRKLRQLYEEGILDEATYQATVTVLQAGSGAVAQSGGVAAGAGGVAVGGNVSGNIYVGASVDDQQAALAIYLEFFARGCRQLALRAIDVGASDALGERRDLDLDQVYIALDTTSTIQTTAARRQTRTAPAALERETAQILSLLEATSTNRQLVILGAPGSGKSTFLSHLGLCLALHTLRQEPRWLERLPGWPATDVDLIPITVVIRDFARAMETATHIAATPSHLWHYLVQRLEAQNLGFVAQPLQTQLDEGRVLLLLDGLDEIPNRRQRHFVRDAIIAFATRYSRCRVLVTCRILSYQEAEWQLPTFPTVTIADFDAAKIRHFISAWYAELERIHVLKATDATWMVERLQTAVNRTDLQRLAPNPLLLTVMALVHTHRGQLPDARALLYEETVDLLLLRWEEAKGGGGEPIPGLRQLLAEAGRGDVDLKRVLWRLAFQSHEQLQSAEAETLADIGELTLIKALAELHPTKSHDWANRLIELMKVRAGLLLERAPERYSFPHRTFQEYLAGAHLATQATFSKVAVQLVNDAAFWRQVILLGVGRLVYLNGDFDKPLALVGELAPHRPPRTQAGWRQVWLAGEVLIEIGINRVTDSELGRDLLKRVQRQLATLVAKAHLTPVERADAGRILGELGDPRAGVGLKAGLPDIEWVTVEAGSFLMGSDKAKDDQARGEELPQFTCELVRQPYQISRYPVTVAQYQCFVAAGGYGEAAYWPEAIAQGLWRDGRIRCRTWSVDQSKYEEEWATGPANYGARFAVENQPQVGVSWYEALAFCRWLAVQSGKPVRLPMEAEWERAARHTDGRTYPWGNQDDVTERCNLFHTGINSPSAVGIFPTGDAQCGTADMAGNVWEWCSTQWLENYEGYATKVDDALAGDAPRVVRGGSFVNGQDSVRCAARDGVNPVNRNDVVGFRIVCAPGRWPSGLWLPSGL